MNMNMKITSGKLLANVLRNYRIEQNKTQGQVGNTVGVKQATISSFENNPDSTKLETLFKILNALNLELSVRERGMSHGESSEGW